MRGERAGVTLLEILVATTLAGLALAVAYPGLDRALDGVRLRSASDAAGTLLLQSQQYADRNRTAVAIRIDPSAGLIQAATDDGTWHRELAFRPPVRIVSPDQELAVILRPADLPPNLTIAFAVPGERRLGFSVDPLDGTLRDLRTDQ